MTAKRIRREYGSIRAAIQHCISLNLSLSETAEQLQCSRDFLRVREVLFGLSIRRKTRDEQRHNKPLPKRLVKGRALAYMTAHGMDRSDPETIYRAEVTPA